MVLAQEVFYVIVAELLILVPGGSHIALCSRVTHPLRIPFCVISAIFIVLDSFFLLFTVFRNPGKLEKNYTTEDPETIVEVSGQSFCLKSCITCKCLKGLRTHHCRVCDCCVDRLDHHCPWVANCIGRNNHRSFVLLLISTTVNAVYMLVANAIEMGILHPPPGNFGGEAILLIYSIVLGWSVGSLLFYQCFLIVKNKTTHEHRRSLFKTNPFDYGLWRNCRSFWSMKKDLVTPVISNKT